ncbi:hypothetical protein MUK42_07943 [Musa troglodytarum]|nr:hypothetical protein MUK42_07943 [Musa troglodytarum]URD74904.1 hypothetical protein MUK42_07943 [Musa troglodytarum]
MQKIASHIKNPAKFSKASKLAMQLIQAGSVKSGTSNQFFDILEAAMASPSVCNEPSVRMDYQALFSAVQDVAECFSKQQKNQLAMWTLHVVANDLYTDDSFVYSKAAGKIKDAISSLPPATVDDDKEEAAALALAENKAVGKDTAELGATTSATLSETKNHVSDPFGLDVLLPSKSKKDKRARGKDVTSSNQREEEAEEPRRFIKYQREALLLCLEIAARRYKVPWAQTVIDILVKHAFDNIDKFTARQRDAIEKLWASIRNNTSEENKEVRDRKLDMNASNIFRRSMHARRLASVMLSEVVVNAALNSGSVSSLHRSALILFFFSFFFSHNEN